MGEDLALSSRLRTDRGTGIHWWDWDRLAHEVDAPRHCPACGARIAGLTGTVIEYWTSADRVFAVNCGECFWAGEVTPLTRAVGWEPEGEGH